MIVRFLEPYSISTNMVWTLMAKMTKIRPERTPLQDWGERRFTVARHGCGTRCCLPVGTSAGRRPDRRVGAIHSKVLIIGEGEIKRRRGLTYALRTSRSFSSLLPLNIDTIFPQIGFAFYSSLLFFGNLIHPRVYIRPLVDKKLVCLLLLRRVK